VNHHWLSGVAFYLVNYAIHIEGLMILYVIMIAAALFFALKRTYDRAGFVATALVAPFLVLFIAERHTVRPEGFGLLFLTLMLWYLDRAEQQKTLSWKDRHIHNTSTTLGESAHLIYLWIVCRM
jgi:4-amino-4-deoxy-L-arabinose transferase-like glycosyltransferase